MGFYGIASKYAQPTKQKDELQLFCEDYKPDILAVNEEWLVSSHLLALCS